MKSSSPYFLAAMVTIGAIALALGTVLLAEHVLNIPPCPLCYKQRWPYYIGWALALALLMASRSNLPLRYIKTGFLVLVFIFVWSLYLAVQHSGVELGWWNAPAGCIASSAATTDANVLLESMKHTIIVPCDRPSWELFGALSFANLNAILSLLLLLLNGTVLIASKTRGPYGSSTESQ